MRLLSLKKLFGKGKEPPVPPEQEWFPPTADTVRRRLVILWCNAGRSHFENEHLNKRDVDLEIFEKIKNWLSGPLSSDATSREIDRHKAEIGAYTSQERVNDWWDQEAAVVLQWALGMSENLPAWDTYGEWDERTDELFDLADPLNWQLGRTLRSPDEIESIAQSYEARYWRIRDMNRGDPAYARKLMGRAHQLGQVELASDGELAFSDGSSVIDGDDDKLSIVTSIVIERLHALNWLCGQDSDWDSITCDTIVSWLWDENWP